MYMKYKIGQPCAIGRDCYNYNCVNGMCTRKKRKYKKKIGDSCDKDNSCYSDVCMDGICVRKTKKRTIDSPCNTSDDCYNKNCVNGVCTRKNRKYKKKLGVPCNTEKECYSKNCVSNVCTRRNKKKKTKTARSFTRSLMDQIMQQVTPSFDTADRIDKEIMQMEKEQNEPELVSADIDAIEVEANLNGVGDSNNNNNEQLEEDIPLSKILAKSASEDMRKSKSKSKSKDTIVSKQISPPSTIDVNKYFLVPSTEELLKVKKDLNTVGITDNVFYYDACEVLNGLQKMMKRRSFEKYMNKMYLLLPIIYPNDEFYRTNHYISNNMTNKTFIKQMRNSNLGGNPLDICFDKGCSISSGQYGRIYNSKFKGKSIVIKEPKSRGSIQEQNHIHNEVFDENIIHSELYCALSETFGDMAHIPKIEFMARLYMPESKMKIITGIEKLDGDLSGFLRNIIPTMTPEKVDSVLKDALIQLCKLLELLQDRYNFHHRDLHGHNIMYKNIGSRSEPVYRWFMIDYGFAYLEKDGIQYHKDEMGPYSKYSGPNFAHDFRMVFVHIMNNLKVTPKMKDESLLLNFMNYVAFELKNEFLRMGGDVKIDVDEDGVLHWHNAYNFFEKKLYTDTFTNPRSLRNMLETDTYKKYSQPMRSF